MKAMRQQFKKNMILRVKMILMRLKINHKLASEDLNASPENQNTLRIMYCLLQRKKGSVFLCF